MFMLFMWNIKLIHDLLKIWVIGCPDECLKNITFIYIYFYQKIRLDIVKPWDFLCIFLHGVLY